MKTQTLQDFYLVALTGGLLFLVFTLLAPFATTIMIALLLVALFQPFYKSMQQQTKSKMFATITSTVLVILVVVVPVTLMITVLSNELTNIANRAIEFVNTEVIENGGGERIALDITEFVRRFNPSFVLDFNTVQGSLSSIVTSAGNVLPNFLLSTFQNIGGIFVQLIVFLFSLALLFQDYDKLPRFIRRYSPLSNELDTLLFDKFIETGKSVLKGIFLVSLIHALVMSTVFYFFGVQGLGLFFLLLFISSLIPGGSQIVWFPVGIALGFISGWPIGVALLIVGFISMNLIDSLIRPVLTNGSAEVHPLLSLISVLGGLVVYGLPGLLYGPLIAVLFMAIVGAYNRRFKESEKV